MAKAIIMDIGGVIFNINQITKEYQIICKQQGIEGKKPWDDFREEWNKTKLGELECSEFYKIIAKKLKVSDKKIKSLFVNNVQLNSEMKETIIQLSKKNKIGFLTNIIKDLLQRDLELWDFSKIGTVVTSCDYHIKKPDLDAIDTILNKMKLTKKDIIFIDDSKKTIDTYSNYGIKCILFKDKAQMITELKKYGIYI